jgi:hypothetical protein
LRAYAARQAKLCAELHDKARWKVVPEMLKRAKMEVVNPNLLFQQMAKERKCMFNQQKGASGMLRAIRADKREAARRR